jgi:glycosyltransferase involved in cell wall biosynthesis
MYLSIVIPIFNEEPSLQPLHDDLVKILKEVTDDYEIIFVDDGSTDRSSGVVELIHHTDPRVRLVQFRRNFGKSAALSAGFEEARGRLIVTMDGDLQDDPREIPRLIEAIHRGLDLVSGWKQKRQDSLTRTVPSKIFNWFVPLLAKVDLHDLNCGFKAYRSEVVKGMPLYGELHRYIPVLAHWRGFKIGEIPVNHLPRSHGKSKFGAERFLRGMFDFVTVYFITRYLKRPLHFFGGVGSIVLAVGFLISAYFGVQWLLGTPLHLRPIMVFSWVLLIVGVQLIMMGLIGEMITHATRNRRDTYEVSKRLG